MGVSIKSSRRVLHAPGLFGEATALLEPIHCETIAVRSTRHSWELAPHRHPRLHQVLWMEQGAGTVEIDGVDVGGLSRRQRRRLRREQLGVVLPHPSDNLFDHLDAQRNVQWADRARGGRTGSIVDAPDALELLGLAQARHRWTRQLSGGEQQRVALACALAGGPTLVVCGQADQLTVPECSREMAAAIPAASRRHAAPCRRIAAGPAAVSTSTTLAIAK